MILSLESSIVRTRTPDDPIAGAGFLIGNGLILTCAHVVASALDVPESRREAPADELLLDFPLVEPACTMTARVIH